MNTAAEMTENLERSEAMDRRRGEALRTCRAIERGWLSSEEIKAANEGLVDYLWYLKSSYNERDKALRKLLRDEEDLPAGLPSPISELKGGPGPSKSHMLLFLTIKIPGLTNEGYAAIMNPAILSVPKSHPGRRAYISAVSGASGQLRLDPGTKKDSMELLEKTPDTASKKRYFRCRPRPEVLRTADTPWVEDPLLFPSSRGEGPAPELTELPPAPPPYVRKDPLADAFRAAGQDMKSPSSEVDDLLNSLVDDDPPVVQKAIPVTLVVGDKPGPEPDPEPGPGPNPVARRLIAKHQASREVLVADQDQILGLIEAAKKEIRELEAKSRRLTAEILEADIVIDALSQYGTES